MRGNRGLEWACERIYGLTARVARSALTGAGGGSPGTATLLARALAAADPRGCATHLENVSRLLPGLSPSQAQAMARRMSVARMERILEMTAMDDRALPALPVRGTEARSALETGAVILLNHVGNGDLGLRALAQGGFHIFTHADHPLGPLLWRGFTAERRRRGIHYLPRQAGLFPLLRALGRGQLAAVSWDGRACAGRGDEFRGIEAAAALSARAGVPLLQAACLPEAGGWALQWSQPLRIPMDSVPRRECVEHLIEAELDRLREHLALWTLRAKLTLSPRSLKTHSPCASPS